ncbi:DNA-3-methyladenine glycosylase [Beijerinckia sp. L45]|uniref:DNA-3-methyladenine glycosylase family protein n=1 Tax=Beijerinckia sp. L45 TaxID=1641855 RepID=UPI00131BFD95|nr:DNA-3-methyladenine glycosylase 2 family protein [Beijerinckia sp. L45]
MLVDQGALDRAVAALAALDPAFVTAMLAQGGQPMLRRRAPGFEGLVWIVVSQQVSTASAAAIFARLKARFPAVEAATLAAASDEDLKLCGLSGPKIRTLRALGAAHAAGTLDFDRLTRVSAEAAHAELVAIKGIGPWTADVFLLFCLGHPDAWPAGDIALQEAARAALSLSERPNTKGLDALGARWRPWRGVAAYLLWSAYRAARMPVTA